MTVKAAGNCKGCFWCFCNVITLVLNSFDLDRSFCESAKSAPYWLTIKQVQITQADNHRLVLVLWILPLIQRVCTWLDWGRPLMDSSVVTYSLFWSAGIAQCALWPSDFFRCYCSPPFLSSFFNSPLVLPFVFLSFHLLYFCVAHEHMFFQTHPGITNLHSLVCILL